MSLGVLLRADEGGLGTLTQEVARHVDPDGVLIVEVDPPRGHVDLTRYQGAAHVTRISWPWRPGDEHTARAFAEAHRTIYTAETLYGLPRTGGRLVVHAMPELWAGETDRDVWAPTSWQLHRLPHDTRVMPVPVDRERCAPREVTRVRRMLHVSAPAMLDRNGTQFVAQALPYCHQPFELIITGPGKPLEATMVGKVKVTPGPDVRDYWRAYDDVDALVLPRRYGGLSLPMQEAASIGLPIVSLALEPQVGWLCPYLAVPTLPGPRRARMKGGDFVVYEASPEALALTLDALVGSERIVAEAHTASLHWGKSLAWDHWAPTWKEALA